MKLLFYFWALVPLVLFLFATLLRIVEGERPSRYFYGPRSTQVYDYRLSILDWAGFVSLAAWTASVILIELQYTPWIVQAELFSSVPRIYRETAIFPVLCILFSTLALLVRFLYRVFGTADAPPPFGYGLARLFVAFFVAVLVAGGDQVDYNSSPLSEQIRVWVNQQAGDALRSGIDGSVQAIEARLAPAATPTPRIVELSAVDKALTGIEEIDSLLIGPTDESAPMHYLEKVDISLRAAQAALSRSSLAGRWTEITRGARTILSSRVIYAFQANIRANRELRERYPDLASLVQQNVWLTDKEFIRWLKQKVANDSLIFGPTEISGISLAAELEYFEREWGT